MNISSVVRDFISSGMSSHVSSAGRSGVVSIAASGFSPWGFEDDEPFSGFFSLLFVGGGFGGCVDAIGGTEGESEGPRSM